MTKISKISWLFLFLFAVLAVTMVLSLGIGRYPVAYKDVAGVLFSGSYGEPIDPDDFNRVVVEILRLPRIILVVLVGMGLALAGAAMQGVFRNPLVGPEIAGVSAGASFGGVLAILMNWREEIMVLAAFIFGFGSLTAAFAISHRSVRGGLLSLILAGVVMSSFFSALIGLASYVADPENKLPALIYWLMGSFSAASYERAALMAGIMVISGGGLLGLSWKINLLSLGDSDASALGIKVDTLRWTVVALVALIVAGQVAVSGGIGWVGLVVPHIARMLVGPEHSRLLPVSALMGGIYLLLMDDLARSISAFEVPIGLLTSLAGSPAFVYLLLRARKKGWGDQ
ncbi:MAG: iron ABC transporter permease [Deltaproteobacteria bacterium]|jgi:iron complex transport system permease protein|nr:iron ABC transporter permease [Deltaproteobacteria bacterium]